MADSFSVFCLYADDVRHEVNGKASFIGTYMGVLNAIVPGLPGILPKLVVSIYVTLPPTLSATKAHIDVLLDETTLQTIDISSAQMGLLSAPAKAADADAQARVLNALLVLEAMPLKGNGTIQVKVALDDEVVMGTPLRISVKVAQPVAAPQ